MLHLTRIFAADDLAFSGQQMTGFSFDNFSRNSELDAALGSKSGAHSRFTSTGTTIVGCIFRDGDDVGVVLGADTRATNGMIVADKNCEKIHTISDRIYCCGAGTAADTEHVTRLISSNLALHAYSTGKQPRVVTAKNMMQQHLFKHSGNVGASLVLGGYDPTGPSLYTITDDGSVASLPYTTMGSGCLASMAVFESKWRENLTREQTVELVSEAIEFGILNDLGSGSYIDLRIISKDGAQKIRNYKPDLNVRSSKLRTYKFAKGTTAIRHEKIQNLIVSDNQFTFLVSSEDGKKSGLGETMELTS